MPPKPGRSSNGLVISGAICLLTGIAAAYLVKAHGNVLYAEERFRFILLATIIVSGIFFISASAQWWMRR